MHVKMDLEDCLSDLLSNDKNFDEANNSESGEDENATLSATVRKVYRDYLLKCLSKNFQEKCGDEKLRQILDYLELKATKESISSVLYRRNMLKMIAQVKENSFEDLLNNLTSNRPPVKRRDALVQTEDLDNCMLQSAFVTSNTMDVEVGPVEVPNQIMPHDIVIKEDAESNDSLMKNMEDMFAEESDDSDITNLIEKHASISNKPVQEAPKPILEIKQENKENRKKRSKWYIEMVHRSALLRNTLNDLSLNNREKYDKARTKFLELFGEDSEDEGRADTLGFKVEEHLPACKERIAPWIVKYLMPYYKKRRIADRRLFKEVAKHITDMLILQDTFPEERQVKDYIKRYFERKGLIRTKHEIYEALF